MSTCQAIITMCNLLAYFGIYQNLFKLCACAHCAGSEGAADHVLFPKLPHYPGPCHRGCPRLRFQGAGQFNEGFKCRPLISIYSMLFRAVLGYIFKIADTLYPEF
jgi:hypothetical protein